LSRVHIVLVNWNGWRDTVECLESLFRLPENEFRVTVCDNGSTDNSLAHLVAWLEGDETAPDGAEQVWSKLEPKRHRAPSYRVVTSSDAVDPQDSPLVTIVDGQWNAGFAAGCNIGVRRALADPECGFIWLLNNDTVVTPGALRALRTVMDQEPDVAVCGSTLLYYDSPDTVQGLGGQFFMDKARGVHIGNRQRLADLPSRAEIEKQLSYVIGASMFVRRSLFERTGGLSEDYFLYFEEIDLATRLLHNERNAWAPESVVFHKEGRSIGSNWALRPSDTAIYYISVNTLRFYRKFHFRLLPLAFARLVRESFEALRRRDWGAIRIAMLATADFVLGVRRTGAVGIGHPENSRIRLPSHGAQGSDESHVNT